MRAIDCPAIIGIGVPRASCSVSEESTMVRITGTRRHFGLSGRVVDGHGIPNTLSWPQIVFWQEVARRPDPRSFQPVSRRITGPKVRGNSLIQKALDGRLQRTASGRSRSVFEIEVAEITAGSSGLGCGLRFFLRNSSNSRRRWGTPLRSLAWMRWNSWVRGVESLTIRATA